MSSVLPASNSAPVSAAARPFGLAPVPGIEAPPGGDGAEQNFSFGDFLSVINPLQHIPIVGTIYRAVTGDTLAPAARVIGGTLFGGPIGLVASAFSAMVEQTTGKDFGDKALALLTPDAGKPAAPPAQYAATPTTQATPTVVAASAPPPNLFVDPPAEENTESPAAPGAVAPASSERAINLAHQNGFRPAANSDRSNPPPGRTLADYRSFAGRPLPTVDATRSTSATAPVRLQTTGPMTPERGRTPVIPTNAPTDSAAGNQTSSQATGESPPSAPQTHWFQAAMMKGLDRYRDGRRADAPQQVDTNL